MTYKFVYKINNSSHFTCNLKCVRCTATNSSGTRCKLKSCIGTPYCWTHLLHHKHLRIKPSVVQGAGNGLFAVSPALGNNDIVFKRGDVIIQYDGEVITNKELQRRYGDFTAPYGLSQGNYIEDGACRRGVGSLANHVSSRSANARYSFSTSTKKFRLVATKNIRNNTEVLCDYGGDYHFNEPTQHKTSK